MNAGRAFQAAFLHSVREGIAFMQREAPDKTGREYAEFLGRAGAAVAAANMEAVGDVHVFHTDLLEDLRRELTTQGARQADFFMQGFADGACAAVNEPSREPERIVAALEAYCRTWSQRGGATASHLARIAETFANLRAVLLETAWEGELDRLRVVIFDTLHERVAALKNRQAAHDIESRIRAFLSGYLTALTYGVPEHAWSTYDLLLGRAALIPAAAFDSFSGLMLKRVAGFLGAALARGEPADDVQAFLEERAYGKRMFAWQAPFAGRTDAGRRVEAYLKGVGEGMASAVQVRGVRAYSQALPSVWPFRVIDFSFSGKDDHAAITQYLEALLARLDIHGEPQTVDAAHQRGWVEGHVMGSLHQAAGPALGHAGGRLQH